MFYKINSINEHASFLLTKFLHYLQLKMDTADRKILMYIIRKLRCFKISQLFSYVYVCVNRERV